MVKNAFTSLIRPTKQAMIFNLYNVTNPSTAIRTALFKVYTYT